MASLISKLTLTGTSANFGAVLSLAVDEDHNATKPFKGISKLTLPVHGTKATLDSTGSTDRFVYVQHTGLQSDGVTAATEQIQVWIHDGSGDRDCMRLKTGEWAWFPVKSSNLVKLQSSGPQTIITEYAWFSRT